MRSKDRANMRRKQSEIWRRRHWKRETKKRKEAVGNVFGIWGEHRWQIEEKWERKWGKTWVKSRRRNRESLEDNPVSEWDRAQRNKKRKQTATWREMRLTKVKKIVWNWMESHWKLRRKQTQQMKRKDDGKSGEKRMQMRTERTWEMSTQMSDN